MAHLGSSGPPRRLSVAVAVACGVMLVSSAVGQVVCYVDHHRLTDAGDGLSWGTAKMTIQAAVDISAPALCDQIWVAKGTYVQASSLVIDFRTPDIYGGFEVGDIQLSQRDWVANETIIDGNDALEHVIVIENSAAPIIDGFTITGGTDWDSNLDEGGGIHMTHCGGLVPEVRNNFIHGNGSIDYGHGGGIYVWNCSPVISNNIFQDNMTKYLGHHVDLDTSWATITNNTFLGNFSIDNTDGTPTISNNIFWGGTTTNSKITNDALSSPVIQYNDIQQPGYGDGSGGPDVDGNINVDPLLFGTRPRLRAGSPAIDAGLNAAPGLPATDFEGDARIIDGDENGTATVDMGADEAEPAPISDILYVDGSVSATGSGSSWSDPMKSLKDAVEAAQDGEEIWVKAGTYPFTTTASSVLNIGIFGGFAGGETQRDQRDPSANETILDGQDSSGTLSVSAAAVVDGFTLTRSTSHSASTISNCKFIANPGVLYADTVRDCRFENNPAGALSGGDTVEDSVFIGNSRSGASGTGGAIIAGSSTIVDRCVFLDNSAGQRGGAIHVGSGGNLDVRNSLFVGNHAGADDSWEGGGAIYTYNSAISVTNSTFYGNYTENSGMGGAIGSHFNVTTYTVVNSVFWSNVADNNSWSNNLRGDPTVTYSILDPPVSGTGNKNANPGFMDPDGADNVLGTEDDDLRLGASSPAVDAGNNVGIDVCSKDLDRGQRFLDDPGVDPDTGNGTAPIIDMGAYERGGSATEYALTMAVTGSGTTDPAVGTNNYPVCSVVNVSATPASGWDFTGWTGDVADPGSAMTTVTMLGVRSATANFFQAKTADVGIDKTNSVNELMPAETFVYEIAVWSFGPDQVSGVTVSDVMPSEVESCSWTCTAHSGSSCTASGSGNVDEAVSLPAMSWMQYLVTCSVRGDASGSVSNTASVSLAAGDTDPDLSDNDSTDTDAIVPTGTCGSPDTRDLSGLDIEDQRTYVACQSITGGDLAVQTGGDVMLRAGIEVSLGEDFKVEDLAELIVEIDPTLIP